jgi:predicted DNA-binding transcriptional regulator AlpA
MHPNVTPSPSAILPNPGDYVSTDEAARILDVSRQTLCNWRWKRQGPRVHKIGVRLVRYHRADLAAFAAGESGRDQAA